MEMTTPSTLLQGVWHEYGIISLYLFSMDPLGSIQRFSRHIAGKAREEEVR